MSLLSFQPQKRFSFHKIHATGTKCNHIPSQRLLTVKGLNQLFFQVNGKALVVTDIRLSSRALIWSSDPEKMFTAIQLCGQDLPH